MYGYSSLYVDFVSNQEFDQDRLKDLKEDIIGSYEGTYDWLMDECMYLSVNEDGNLHLFADVNDIVDSDEYSLFDVLNHITKYITGGWQDQTRDLNGNVECKWIQDEGMSTCRVVYFVYDEESNEFTMDVCECADVDDDWGVEYDEY
mgnify:FL=1